MRKTLRILLVLAACLLGLAQAASAGPKAQVPGYYRFQVGQLLVTALFDGAIDLDVALLKNTTPEELSALLPRLFVGNPKMQTAVNAYLVETAGRLVLLDTGMGAHRGPALGHIIANLRAAGYDPAQVDVIALTHMHTDHLGGLTDAAGKPLFPRARVLVAAEESAYWLSASSAAAAPEARRPSFAFAAKMIAPYQASGRWQTFAQGAEIAPGIRAVAAFGHTPGHTAFAVESGGQKLLVFGDVVHAHAVQFARPDVTIDFDTDQKAAAATRRALFKDAAAGGWLVGGIHLPFPGLGHVRAEGADAYAWVPVEFTPLKDAGK